MKIMIIIGERTGISDGMAMDLQLMTLNLQLNHSPYDISLLLVMDRHLSRRRIDVCLVVG